MDPAFWLERWQQRQTGWHQDDINPHLQEHWPTLGIDRRASVFVPLCGKTRDLLWLASQGHPVIGVELSETAVSEYFAEQGLTPTVTDAAPFRRYQVDELTLLCGDFFDLTPAHLAGVGAIYDRAALIALPPEMRQRYVQHMASLFPNPIDCLLITLDYDQTAKAGPPFAVSPEEVERLYGMRYLIEQLAVIDVLEEWPHVRRGGLTALSEPVYWLKPRG